METHPGEGVVKEKFPNTREPSHRWVSGEFCNLERQHNRERKKKKKEPTDYTPSRDFQPNLCLCGVPETLNLSSLDLGSARNPGPTLDSSPAEQPGAWAVLTRKAHTRGEQEQTQCGPVTTSTPHTHQWYFFAVFLPPHSTTEQLSLNKWPPLLPCVRAEIRHWRDLQTEETKIKKEERTTLKVTGATD